MSPGSLKRLCGRRCTLAAQGAHDLPDRESAAGGASLVGLSLVPRCLLGRLVSFQAGGVPLRHFPPPHYRNVDNRSMLNAHSPVSPIQKPPENQTQGGSAEDEAQPQCVKGEPMPTAMDEKHLFTCIRHFL